MKLEGVWGQRMRKEGGEKCFQELNMLKEPRQSIVKFVWNGHNQELIQCLGAVPSVKTVSNPIRGSSSRIKFVALEAERVAKESEGFEAPIDITIQLNEQLYTIR